MAPTLESNNSLVDLDKFRLGEMVDKVPFRDLGPNPGTFAILVDREASRYGIEAWGSGVARDAGQGVACHGLGLDRRHDGLVEIRRCQLATKSVLGVGEIIGDGSVRRQDRPREGKGGNSDVPRCLLSKG